LRGARQLQRAKMSEGFEVMLSVIFSTSAKNCMDEKWGLIIRYSETAAFGDCE
jgi:hypothetical protein